MLTTTVCEKWPVGLFIATEIYHNHFGTGTVKNSYHLFVCFRQTWVTLNNTWLDISKYALMSIHFKW